MRERKKVTFDPVNHTYKCGEIEYPNFTRIVSDVGVRKDEDSPITSLNGHEFMDNGCSVYTDFGKKVHEHAVMLWARYTIKSCDPKIEPYTKGISNFLRDYDLHEDSGSLVETPLVHEMLGFATTPDLFHVKRKIDVEWKSSNIPSKLWGVQKAAHKMAIHNNYHCSSKGWKLYSVMLGPQYMKNYKIIQDDDMSNDWLSILNVYKLGKKGKI